MRKKKAVDIDALVNDYSNGTSMAKLRLKYNISTSTIKNRLLNAGCELRSLSEAIQIASEEKKDRSYNHPVPDITILKRMYLDEQLNPREISELIGLSQGWIRKQFSRHDIKTRSNAEARAIMRQCSDDEINYMYVDEKLTPKEIGLRCGMTNVGVKYQLRRMGIQIRNRTEAWGIQGNHLTLNEQQLEFIDGLMLGDGSYGHGPNNKSVYYSHTDKHYEYIEWLKSKFESLGIPMSKIFQSRDKKFGTMSYKVGTRYFRNWLEQRKRWYPEGAKYKQIPEDLLITPTVLKNWFIGDGTLKRNGQVIITNVTFTKGSLSNIVLPQLKKLHIESVLHKGGNILIKASSRIRFFEYITSDDDEIPPGYIYKFPNESLKKEWGESEIANRKGMTIEISKKLPEMTEIRKLYWEHQMDVPEISELYGVSIGCIIYHMKKHGIPRRSRSDVEALKIKKKIDG